VLSPAHGVDWPVSTRCWCHFTKSDDCDNERFLRDFLGEGGTSSASSIRCVTARKSHPGPKKAPEHGSIHSNFAAMFLRMGSLVFVPPETGIPCSGTYSWRPSIHPGLFRARVNGPFSWSLHALLAIRRGWSHSGKRCAPRVPWRRPPSRGPSGLPLYLS